MFRLQVTDDLDQALSHQMRSVAGRKVPHGIGEIDHQLVELLVSHGPCKF